jgi:hypothetical protein
MFRTGINIRLVWNYFTLLYNDNDDDNNNNNNNEILISLHSLLRNTV